GLGLQRHGPVTVHDGALGDGSGRGRDRGGDRSRQRPGPGVAGLAAQDRGCPAARGIGGAMPIPISYNVRNVIQRPWSTLATTIGIALVVAILIGAFALASGFQAALVETGSDSNAMVLRT